jgi:uncharacterized membrane protein
LDLGSPIPYLLFLHVMGAIVAFGPTYAFSIMGRMAGREPQHGNFSTRQVKAISRAQVYPLAIIQGVTGVLLIIAAGIKPEKQPWLVAGIILYLITLTYALTIQRNAVGRLVSLTSRAPGGGPSAPGAPADGPAAGPPPGPPPGVPETVRTIQRGGIFMGIMIVIIVFLMVAKPGLSG